MCWTSAHFLGWYSNLGIYRSLVLYFCCKLFLYIIYGIVATIDNKLLRLDIPEYAYYVSERHIHKALYVHKLKACVCTHLSISNIGTKYSEIQNSCKPLKNSVLKNKLCSQPL